MCSQNQRLTIEIEPDEPIHGQIVDDSGVPEAFHRWLELSAGLERASRRIGTALAAGDAEASEPGHRADH